MEERTTARTVRSWLRRALAAPFVAIAVAILLLEDWLWDDLQRLAARIGRLPVLRQLEAGIAGLPPYGALAAFAAPSLLLIPVKLAALWFLSHGQPVFGFLVAAGAKVAGTALVARLYTLTEKSLLRIGWFARLHERLTFFKARVYAAIKATAMYRVIHLRFVRLKAALKSLLQRRKGILKRRWEAARKLSRRWRHEAP
ncbi:MAG: hypothetical protein SF339_20025 [Blastocatellia bacterium]|nr:hypothetical protein [Blastocatellia bacterium]